MVGKGGERCILNLAGAVPYPILNPVSHEVSPMLLEMLFIMYLSCLVLQSQTGSTEYL